MSVSLSEFIQQMIADPRFSVIVILILGVIMINGWVDAPNTISTCISTRSLNMKAAVTLAAIFHFFGVVIMTALCARVAETLYQLVNFNSSYYMGLIALSAALISIVLWTLLANRYMLPTSETHALVAGITGAAIATSGGLDAVNGQQWMKIVYGVGIALLMGFVFGWFMIKLIVYIFRNIERNKAIDFFKSSQIFSSAGTSFMHGAQDGQKFIGIFVIALYLEEGGLRGREFQISLWLILLCAIFMTVGTIIGGMRMRRTGEVQRIQLEKYQGFSADFATMGTLFFASLIGVPLSTNHTKISAILGAEAAKGLYTVDIRMMKDMLISLVWTFPGCGIMSALLTLIFFRLF